MEFNELADETRGHLIALYKIGMESKGGQGLTTEVDKCMRELGWGGLADELKNGTYEG